MAFTSFANVFASIDDSVIDALAAKLMRDRPLWFNYGDARSVAHPEALCQPLQNVDPSIPLAARVTLINLPATINAGQELGTLTVPALNFAAQITSVQIDFAPGDIVNLPPELNPPLPLQRLAIHLGMAAGLGDGNATTLSLNCFSLDVYLIAGVQVSGQAPLGQPVTLHIFPVLQSVEIGGLVPDGLRDSIRILLTTFAQTLFGYIDANGGITLVKTIDLKDVKIKVNPFPAPTGPGLPANPAVQQNQFEIFADLNIAP